MKQQPIKIALIAGEDSGDLLGADLLQNLKIMNPQASKIT